MGSPVKSWTVVVFEATDVEKESVQAVPSKWINGDQCLWPILPADKLNNALKNCHFNSCWPSHKVRILRNATFDDYGLARKKSRRAEFTSDLNDSDQENRCRKPNRLYLNSESSESAEEIYAPKTKRLKSIPIPPQMPQKINFDKPLHELDNLLPTTMSGNFRGNFETPTSSHSIHTRDSSQKDLQCCKSCGKSLYVITNLLIDLRAKVDKLLDRPSTNSSEPIENEGILEKSKIDFPMNTTEALNNFNKFLEDKTNYIDLVNYLSKMGGVNTSDFLKRCLSPILTDDVAVKFSYLGRKQKQQFNSLIFCNALIDAALKANVSNDNRKEVEQAIAAWLKRAQERIRRESFKSP